MSGESTGADVEPLVELLARWVNDATAAEQRDAVLASDWLAAHDAATADRVRRETAEGIADALAAHADQPAQTVYHSEYLAGVAHAARIAREQAR